MTIVLFTSDLKVLRHEANSPDKLKVTLWGPGQFIYANLQMISSQEIGRLVHLCKPHSSSSLRWKRKGRDNRALEQGALFAHGSGQLS